MDASAIIAIVAAAISAGAFLATLWQANIARDQAHTAADQADSARAQVLEARAQTALAEQARRDAAQPYVWVDFRLDPAHAFLVLVHLENNGPTVARNVRVSFNPPLPVIRDNLNLQTYSSFADGFSSLPPGRVMEWTLATGPELLGQGNLPQEYLVTITGEGPFGPMDELSYNLGLPEWRHTNATPIGTLHEVKKAIGDLTKAVGSLRGRG